MKQVILECLGKTTSSVTPSALCSKPEEKHKAFLQYYELECRSSDQLYVISHRLLISLVQLLPNYRNKCKAAIQVEVKKLFTTANHASTFEPKAESLALALALRIWLMVNIRSPDEDMSCFVPGRSIFTWNDDSSSTLEEFIKDSIPVPDYTQYSQSFPASFNGRNLVKIGDLTIHWTNNLADHLAYSAEHKRLDLFHFTSFLEDSDSPFSFFDRDFLVETHQTLKLLFQCWDPPTTEFLRLQQTSQKLDSSLVKSLALQQAPSNAADYFYWRNRLLVLKNALDNAQPSGFSSLWIDRRNQHQWWTFWIAVVVFFLTVIFGLISSVTGVLQVYASWKSIPH